MGKSGLPLLLLVALVLAGCATSSANRLWLNRDYQGLSQIGSDEFKRLDVMDLSVVCEGKLKMQKYAEFDQCISILKERLKTERSGNIAITFTHESSMAMVSSQEATKYLELGQYDKAIEVALVGQKLYAGSVAGREGMYKNNVDMLTVGLFSVPAISYAMLGDKKSAELHLQKSLERYSGMNKGFGFTAMHKQEEYWIATSMFVLKDYKRAYEFLLTDRANAGERFYNATYSAHSMADASALYKAVMLNRLALENGDIEQARKGFDAMLNNSLVKQLSEIYFRVLQERARLAVRDHDRKLAEELLLAGINLLETARASIQTESYKLGFAGGRFSIYEDMVSLLIDQNRYDEAFAFAERAKSRALVDMLASKQKFGSRTADLASTQNQLISNLDINEKKTKDLIGETEAVSMTRNLIRKDRQTLSQSAPELSSLVTVEAPVVKDLLALLPQDETLIEYFGSGDNLFAFVATNAGIRATKLSGKGLAEDVSAFREAIHKVNSTAYLERGKKLSERLIAPLLPGVTTKNLTIIPHGPLHYLPFAALGLKNGTLVDQYSLRILPSASVLKFLRKNQNNSGSLMVLGNPNLGDPKHDLPFAQKEAVKVAGDVPGAKLLLREQATETAVKSYGNSFRYLHFASHGMFDAESPLSSGLYLAKDSENDGMLTVGELYQLRLNADLVTLSACETGLGNIANGDDVVGLTRGFMYAGTSSIVSSLWKVDDAATSDLMTGFYANLKKKDKRTALRDAQLATKAKPKYKHPFYWAAFQITGAVQ